jgi:hypothetical protein
MKVFIILVLGLIGIGLLGYQSYQILTSSEALSSADVLVVAIFSLMSASVVKSIYEA